MAKRTYLGDQQLGAAITEVYREEIGATLDAVAAIIGYMVKRLVFPLGDTGLASGGAGRGVGGISFFRGRLDRLRWWAEAHPTGVGLR